ncbi:unnamed protein product, partial [Polarella glacialis]
FAFASILVLGLGQSRAQGAGDEVQKLEAQLRVALAELQLERTLRADLEASLKVQPPGITGDSDRQEEVQVVEAVIWTDLSILQFGRERTESPWQPLELLRAYEAFVGELTSS